MRAVKTLRDAEIIIGQLLDRVEVLETQQRSKIVQNISNVTTGGSQQPDPGSPVQVISSIGGTAGGTYTAVEQSLINTIITAHNNIQNINVANLKKVVDNIRAALRNYGICA